MINEEKQRQQDLRQQMNKLEQDFQTNLNCLQGELENLTRSKNETEQKLSQA